MNHPAVYCPDAETGKDKSADRVHQLRGIAFSAVFLTDAVTDLGLLRVSVHFADTGVADQLAGFLQLHRQHKGKTAAVHAAGIEANRVQCLSLIGIAFIGKPFPDFLILMVFIQRRGVSVPEFPDNQPLCFKHYVHFQPFFFSRNCASYRASSSFAQSRFRSMSSRLRTRYSFSSSFTVSSGRWAEIWHRE